MFWVIVTIAVIVAFLLGWIASAMFQHQRDKRRREVRMVETCDLLRNRR